MMNHHPKPIRDKKDYTEALGQIDQIFDAEEGSPEADTRDILAVLIKDYEEKHYKIDPPGPLSALRFRMDQMNMTAKDMVPFLGSRSRVSEVLAGKRGLSLRMIRALHAHLGIPAEILIMDTKKEGM